MAKTKNSILVYQGGGYDGCIWEWNAWLWDDRGHGSSLLASGCMGIETEEQAREEMDKMACGESADSVVWDLEDEEFMRGLLTDWNATFVLMVLDRASRNVHVVTDWDWSLRCPLCETLKGAHPEWWTMVNLSYAGMHSSHSDCCCNKCADIRLCARCREDGGDPYVHEEGELTCGLCPDCFKGGGVENLLDGDDLRTVPPASGWYHAMYVSYPLERDWCVKTGRPHPDRRIMMDRIVAEWRSLSDEQRRELLW